MKRLAIMAIPFFLLSPPAVAQSEGCYHEGELVPEGTRIGPMVCENGEWVYRPELTGYMSGVEPFLFTF